MPSEEIFVRFLKIFVLIILQRLCAITRLRGLCRRQQNAREDSPRADAQSAGGEEGVVGLVGADAAEAYAVRAQSAVQ